MYTKTNALDAQKAIAMLVALTVTSLGLGFHLMGKAAHAENVTSFSDTLSDSTPGAASNHEIAFTLPNGMAIGQTITVTFPTAAGEFVLPGAGFDFNDMDLFLSGDGEQTLAASAAAGAWGVATTASTVVLETPTDAGVASSSALVLRIGDNATTGATGNSFITNPTATSTPHEIDLATTWDSGHTLVVAVENVVVTAQVDTSFTFTVQGTTTGATINGSGTSTADDTTAVSLPFGTLVAGTSEVLGQDLFVETNAANGFVVTVEASGPFDSSTSADIDWFNNGTYVTTPTDWAAPTGVLGSEETYGHWALTSDDDIFSATQDEWISPSTTPQAIFAHNSVSDGQTSNIGYTNVGYQVEITTLQEAGDDYRTELIYIATPTF